MSGKADRLKTHRDALAHRLVDTLRRYDKAQTLPEEEMVAVALMALTLTFQGVEKKAEKLLRKGK